MNVDIVKQALMRILEATNGKTTSEVKYIRDNASIALPELTWPDTTIPSDNCIELYFHCALCIAEKPPGVSPKEWSQVQVGFTKQGVQVWCNRHECNIVHIAFDGVKHRVNRQSGLVHVRPAKGSKP